MVCSDADADADATLRAATAALFGGDVAAAQPWNAAVASHMARREERGAVGTEGKRPHSTSFMGHYDYHDSPR